MYHRGSGGLVAAGVITRVTYRRTFRRRHGLLRPTDPTKVSYGRAAVRYAVYGRTYPDQWCAALCGLVAAIRVDRGLHIKIPASELVATLRRIAETTCPEGTEIFTSVETIIGRLAVEVYR